MVATHLVGSLRGAGVPEATVDQVIAAVAPLADEIVSRPALTG